MINEEGGIDVEEFRYYAIVDRVNTTGTVWLGLTIGCASATTTSSIPITQREYYQLSRFSTTPTSRSWPCRDRRSPRSGRRAKPN